MLLSPQIILKMFRKIRLNRIHKSQLKTLKNNIKVVLPFSRNFDDLIANKKEGEKQTMHIE